MFNSSSTPVPQANDLDKVCAVVNAVAEGCRTTTEIALALGVSGRQGSYYPNAAAELGLVRSDGGGSHWWTLSDDGVLFAEMPAPDKAAAIVSLLAGNRFLDTFVSVGGAEALRCEFVAEGLGFATVERRLACIASWSEFLLLSADEQVARITACVAGLPERSASAISSHRVSKTSAPKHRVCACGMQIPLAATNCDYCS